MSGKIIDIKTAEEFNELITTKLVCADFWAPWCGPCLQFVPTFTAAAEHCPGTVFVKVNIDDLPEIAQQYGVRSIPTIMLFENGKVKNTQVGRLPLESLVDFGKGL